METNEVRLNPISTSSRFKKPADAYINTLKEIIDLPSKISGITKDMASLEIYERCHNLHEHPRETDFDSPTPLSMKNPLLSPEKAHPLKDEVKRLLSLKVPSRLNMSLMDILRLDTHTYSVMVDAIKEFNKTELAIRQDQEDELKDMLGGDK